MRSFTVLSLVALSCLFVPTASAQSLEEDMAASEAEGSAEASSEAEAPPNEGVVTTLSTSTALNDDQAELEEVAPVESADDGISPTNLPDTDYFFLGAFFRTLIVPDFIQGLFVQYEGGSALNFGGGAYFGWRRNGFNVIAEVWYAGFGHQGFYHGQGADDSEFESIDSQLGVVFGSFLFGWTVPVTEWLGIDIGFGLGIGGMTGSMTRQEAYRDRSMTGSPLAECTGIGTPDPTYCETPVEMPGPDGRLDGTRTMGGTYQRTTGMTNPFYFGDGGVPPMFFWLDLPRIGVTIRPIRQLQIQINGGYNLYGFNFGASLGYGF